MNLLGTFLQAVVSALLLLLPAASLKRDRLKMTVFPTYLAMFSTCTVGGLLFAAPATLILILYYQWIRFVGYATRGTKRTLFFVTIALSAVYLTLQIVHLPIRFALGQPTFLIKTNVAAIFAGVCFYAAPLELMFVLKNSPDEVILIDDPPVELATEPAIQFVPIAEICPYCEASVVPDVDGRCTACHRPIA
ncbi:MAG: hypothetical protein JWM11_4081 [Planctomycetaceae bacterium]|nr:hypothetical protein [Planctomycetaceae bacterium]